MCCMLLNTILIKHFRVQSVKLPRSGEMRGGWADYKLSSLQATAMTCGATYHMTSAHMCEHDVIAISNTDSLNATV